MLPQPRGENHATATLGDFLPVSLHDRAYLTVQALTKLRFKATAAAKADRGFAILFVIDGRESIGHDPIQMPALEHHRARRWRISESALLAAIGLGIFSRASHLEVHQHARSAMSPTLIAAGGDC